MTEQEQNYFMQLFDALREQRAQLELMIMSLQNVLEFEASTRLRAFDEDGH